MALDDLIGFADNAVQIQDQSAAVAGAMLKSHGVNPDAYAQLKSVEKQTGTPAEWMHDDPALAAEKQRQVDLSPRKWDTVASHAPITAGFVSEGDNARLANDDLGNMGMFEQSVKYIKDNVLPVGRAHNQYKQSVGGGYQWIGETLVQPMIDLLTTEGMKDKYGRSNVLTNWGLDMQKQANAEAAKMDAAAPLDDPHGFTAMVRGGMTSTLLQLPTMLIGGTAFQTAEQSTQFVLGALGLMSAGQKYGEKRAEGLDPFQSGMVGAGNFALEVGTEMFPTEKLFELLKPAAKMSVANVFKKVGEIYGGEIVGESINTFLGDIIDKVTTKPNMTTAEIIPAVSDYITSGEAWQNFKDTLGTTLVQSTVMTGGAASINRVGQKYGEHQQKKAETAQQAIMDTLIAAESSNLAKRSPEDFSTFAQRVGKEHGIETFYLQADRILEEAQKQGWTEDQLVTWADQYGITREELNTALISDGHVELEFGKAVAGFQHDDTLKLFQKDLKIDPETSTANTSEGKSAGETAQMVHLNELYQKQQDNLIAPEDLDLWKKDLLAAPGLKGRVKDEHLDLIAARSNVLAKITNVPAIEHANRMLNSEFGLRAIKFKDFQSQQRKSGNEGQGFDWNGVYEAMTADVNNLSQKVKGVAGPATDSAFTKQFSQEFPSLFNTSDPNRPQALYSKGDIQATVKNLRDGKEITGKTQKEIAQRITDDVQNLIEQRMQDLPFQRDSRQGQETLSIRKTQAQGMLVPAVVKDGEVRAAGIGATHYDVHSPVKATIPEGVTEANGFVTPDGQFLGRKDANAWLKENRPDIYKALDKETKKNGLESQAYAHAEGFGGNLANEAESYMKSIGLFQSAPLPEKITIDGVDRWTVNSKGQPLAQTEEGIKNFWAWFGDSKVVDEQGKPLVVYHGTPDVRGLLKEGFKSLTRDGFFASDSHATADSYADDRRAFDYQNAEPQTLAIYLSLQNPMVVDAAGKNWKETEKHLKEAKDQGYDGIIIKNSVDYYNNSKGSKKSTVYSFFDSTSAKSAMNGRMLSRVDKTTLKEDASNSGAFDPSNPNILMQSAFHGSPHTFDKFSLSAIGTGEGAQAYGYGLYMAGNREVAEYYRETLSNRDQSGYKNAHLNAKNIVERLGGDAEYAAEVLSEQIAATDPKFANYQRLKDTLQMVESGAYKKELLQAGRLYKVELAPSEDEYLLWDKPLSEQSEKVKVALASSKYDKLTTAINRVQNGERARDVASDTGLNSLDLMSGLGGNLYEMIASRTSGKAASEYLHSLGIRGIKYLDGTSRGKGDGNYNYVIFSEDDVEITDMFQKQQSNDPLGALSTSGDNIVSLFEKADKSTMLHETAHIFLNDLHYVVENYGVQKEVWEQTKTWLGVGEDGIISTQMHERFAETFEVYLMEGKAPSPALKQVFRMFKNWLTKIYESITSGRFGARRTYSQNTDMSGQQIKISPEISDIFDRMLATEQEITQVRERSALIGMLDQKLLKESGFTKEQIDEYLDLVGQAEDSGKEKMDNHKLIGLKERLEGFRKQALGDAREEPHYAFLEQITDKDAPISINKESLRPLLSEEDFKRLPDIARLWDKNGADINDVVLEHGELYGYESAAQFAVDIANMQPLKKFIDKRVAQLEAEHDAEMDTGEAIRTNSLRKMLEIESRWLEQQAKKEAGKHAKDEADYNEAWKQAEQKLSIAIAEGKKQAEIDKLTDAVKTAKQKMDDAFKAQKERSATVTKREVIRAWAEQVVAGRGIKQFGTINKFIAESRNHRQQAIALARKGDWEGALKSNEQARLTEELLAQTYKARNLWEKMQRNWKKISKWTNDNKNVKQPEDYRNQINRLLAQYGIATKEFDPASKDLHSFVASLMAEDEEGTALPEWVGTEVSDFKTLKWDELQDLNSALKFLYGRGRETIEGYRSMRGENIGDLVGQVIDATDGMKRDKLKTLRPNHGAINKIIRGMQTAYRKYFASTGILRFIAKRMDGYADGTSQELVRRITEGMAESNVRWEEMHKRLEPHLNVLLSDGSKIYDGIRLPEMFIRHGEVWSRQHVVVAALNMGNESNMQRLMDGYNLDENDIEKIKSKLTEADWKAVQGVWDAVDSMWNDISDTHNRMMYFRPKKIQSKAFTVTSADGKEVVMTGGYYPIKYNPKFDSEVAKWNEKQNILQSAEAMLQKPVTSIGATKARAESVSRPLLLSLNVLSGHMNDTIKYITLAEAIRDADRVFGDAGVRFRSQETIGEEMHSMIRPALKNIYRPEPNINGAFERGRIAMSAYYMAYNAWTALQNITGLFPAIRSTGFKEYVQGLAFCSKSMMHPLELHKAMLETSKYMRLREANIERDLKRQVREFEMGGVVVGDKRFTYEDVQGLGWAGIRLVDTLVSLPAWWGRYNAEIEAHGDISKAIAAADTAVSEALGSGLAVDATAIQRSKGIMNLLSPFMSFASTQQEVLNVSTEAMKEGKISKSEWAYDQMMVWVLPSLMSTFMKGALMYGMAAALGLGGDDRKKKNTLDYLQDLASYRLMGLPIVRDIWNVASNAIDKKTPAVTARIPITEPLKMVLETVQSGTALATDSSEKRQMKLYWSLANIASLASGIPASTIVKKIVKGQKDIENHDGWFMNYFIPQEKKKR